MGAIRSEEAVISCECEAVGRRKLMEAAPTLQSHNKLTVAAIRPRCILLAGNAQTLKGDQRDSFEIIRSEFRDAEPITFDELFEKTASLSRLFALSVAETSGRS
jgi:hypothetical protein